MPGFPLRAEKEIQRINRLQVEYFGKITRFFDPPLPEGVPERLERIVETAGIKPAEVVLDVGTGTGILIPYIRKRKPAEIIANDLSEAMLNSVRVNHPSVRTIQGAVRGLTLPDDSLDVVFINACYSNIIDKHGAFTNLARMTSPGGRVIVSHPMGRAFIDQLRSSVPFPLDDFPATETEALNFFSPYGFCVFRLVDEDTLYILNLIRLPASHGEGESFDQDPRTA